MCPTLRYAVGCWRELGQRIGIDVNIAVDEDEVKLYEREFSIADDDNVDLFLAN
jgi:hypothetical protein